MRGHLGGHLFKTHVDDAVLKYLAEKYDIKTMLDIGCGPGGMSAVADSLGIRWTGIDGDPLVLTLCPTIHCHDFNRGSWGTDHYDLAWSVEFLEHVDPEYVPHFMQTFSLCRYAVVTHARPHELNGHHHVNCQSAEYWVEVFNRYGFELDDSDTAHIRSVSSMEKNFMRNTGMVFKKAV